MALDLRITLEQIIVDLAHISRAVIYLHCECVPGTEDRARKILETMTSPCFVDCSSKRKPCISWSLSNVLSSSPKILVEIEGKRNSPINVMWKADDHGTVQGEEGGGLHRTQNSHTRPGDITPPPSSHHQDLWCGYLKSRRVTLFLFFSCLQHVSFLLLRLLTN